MADFLSVTTEDLKAVGGRVEDISGQVRTLYEHMKATINAVTANDSWKSEASEALTENFESASKSFEVNLQKLEALGPALKGIGQEYQDKEDENTSKMKEEEQWQK